MNTYRNNAIIVGVLFLLGFAGVFSPVFIKPLLDSPNYLVELAANKGRVLMSACLSLIMAFACSGIAIGMYPILKKHHGSLSLGAVIFRMIENVFIILAVLGLLGLLTLSQEYVKAGAPAVSSFQTLGALLIGVRIWASQLLSQIGFVLGALMYYYVLFRSKLIPRWLSGWGIVAIILHASFIAITTIGQVDAFSMTPLILLSMPIFFQELTLAGWLIVKGFNPSASNPMSISAE